MKKGKLFCLPPLLSTRQTLRLKILIRLKLIVRSESRGFLKIMPLIRIS